jgi:hypothetical protein
MEFCSSRLPLARLLHPNGTRPWQLFDAARSHQHARRIIATWRRGIQQELYCHDSAISRQAITVSSFQMRRASLACRIAHLAPQTRSPGAQLFFRGAASAIGELL